ncbi:MAG TPA: acyltransferase [Thermomonas sp.]|jgi:peptidoglycan/LPS O-acetylase OafA/YrhL|uniref:acyltransferase family protein n=1 Tax=Thermomonas sp. TaxID=1971895 RepID=UPI002B939EDF|nr:acyltransferase [Thermomonas sp.]HPM57860.1 acyltransferase [Thermomonas sp.]HPW13918.1 acyltransferase [Thermomonas sp.]
MQIRRLNTLRAIAALIVLVGHYSNRAQLWDAVLGTRAPQLGVMLFFLLSAFLMSVLYIDRVPDAHAMRRYGLARAGRVLPLFVAVVLLSWALGKVGIPWLAASVYDIPDWKAIASHLAFVYGAQVLWTIPAEIHFYLVFALLWWLRPRLPWAIPLFCTAVLALYASGHWPVGPKQPWMGFPIDLPVLRGLPYFVAGMAIGMLYLRWQAPARWRHHGFVAALGLILLLYPAIFQRLTGWSYGMGGGESPMWFLPPLLLAMSAIFFVLVFLVPDGNPVLEHRVGDYLGNISYSMYLLHFPVLLAMGQFGLAKGVGGLLLFLGITVLASSLSYRFFERPMRMRIRAKDAPAT